MLIGVPKEIKHHQHTVGRNAKQNFISSLRLSTPVIYQGKYNED
jgi:hypothetical protein